MAVLAAGQSGNTLNLTNTVPPVVNELSMTANAVSHFQGPTGAGLVLAGVQQDTTLVRFDESVQFRIDVAFQQSNMLEVWPPWTSIAKEVKSFEWARGRSQPFGAYGPGGASVELNDPTFKYAGISASSNYVEPRRQIRIQAVYNGSTYGLFRGFVDEWDTTFVGTPNYTRTVITATDATEHLANREVSVASSSGETGYDRFNALLDAAEWSTELRSYTTTNDSADLLAHTVEEQPVLTELRRVASSRYAKHVWVDGDGRVRYSQRILDGAVVSSFGPRPAMGFIGTIPYVSGSLNRSPQQVWNSVSISQVNSTVLVVSSTDQHSLAQYGQQSLRQNDLLVSSPSGLALQLVTALANPIQVATVTWNADGPTNWTTPLSTSETAYDPWYAAMALDLDARVSYTFPGPSTGSASNASVAWVESIAQRVNVETQEWQPTITATLRVF